MAASKEDIRKWLHCGVTEGATHMLVVCDGYENTDYPVYVGGGDDPREVAKKFTDDMQRVVECYAMHLDAESQLSEYRAHHYESKGEQEPAPPLANRCPVCDAAPGVQCITAPYSLGTRYPLRKPHRARLAGK